MSDKIDDGGPAFPHFLQSDVTPGMSLRDWFAGQALTGVIAAYSGDIAFPSLEGAAAKAYNFADAMLAARKKTEA